MTGRVAELAKIEAEPVKLEDGHAGGVEETRARIPPTKSC